MKTFLDVLLSEGNGYTDKSVSSEKREKIRFIQKIYKYLKANDKLENPRFSHATTRNRSSNQIKFSGKLPKFR